MTVLACDFGGQRIKLGVIKDGAVLNHRIIAAQSNQPLSQRLPEVARVLREICAEAGITPDSCHGVSVAYPSIVDTVRGRIVDEFGKFGDASQFSPRQWAMSEFGIPLAIDNDARMAVIGEWQWGAARGYENVVMMTLGTGLGGGAIIGGTPLRGCHGQAGILSGHLTVQLDGRPCVCGNVGCAEAEASTSVLARVAAHSDRFATSRLARFDDLSYEAVFQSAAAGDALAIQLQQHSLKVWGSMAVNMIHAYDPEILVLGGGIMGSATVVLPAITKWVRQHVHTPWGEVAIVPSQLGDQAALLAAEWSLRELLTYGSKCGDFQL